MNPHLAIALNLYESRNIDIQSLIGWHLCHGIVVSTPDVFALCFHSKSDDSEDAVLFEEADTLYVTICCGDMASGLRTLKDNYKYIAFRRDFKGSSRNRLLNMKTFYSKLR
jgi:hypothetical protein